MGHLSQDAVVVGTFAANAPAPDHDDASTIPTVETALLRVVHNGIDVALVDHLTRQGQLKGTGALGVPCVQSGWSSKRTDAVIFDTTSRFALLREPRLAFNHTPAFSIQSDDSKQR